MKVVLANISANCVNDVITVTSNLYDNDKISLEQKSGNSFSLYLDNYSTDNLEIIVSGLEDTSEVSMILMGSNDYIKDLYINQDWSWHTSVKDLFRIDITVNAKADMNLKLLIKDLENSWDIDCDIITSDKSESESSDESSVEAAETNSANRISNTKTTKTVERVVKKTSYSRKNDEFIELFNGGVMLFIVGVLLLVVHKAMNS